MVQATSYVSIDVFPVVICRGCRKPVAGLRCVAQLGDGAGFQWTPCGCGKQQSGAAANYEIAFTITELADEEEENA